MTTGISEYSEVVQTARDYYNSDDAEAFYSTIWGGEDIHIGMYHREGDSIAEAGRRATARLARTLEPLGDWAARAGHGLRVWRPGPVCSRDVRVPGHRAEPE